MSLLQDKYKILAPRAEYICDEVVLAQAWKKSHTYIRRHNWYSDTLELDYSAVDLSNRLAQWTKELRENSFSPSSVWLVPAPKSAPWTFGTEHASRWGPVDREANYLRPLAHIGIREQTVATAVMLCLADVIETAQGDPSVDYRKGVLNNMFSYGNRLYCHWPDGRNQAHFSWGNSNTYSRYFKDYQCFVERSTTIAHDVYLADRNKSVFIVKLDLSAFYDNVDIPSLITCLKREYENYCIINLFAPAADAKFWEIAQKALTFSWRPEDQVLAKLFKGGELPRGLPQGLVASGFFANAYLLDFDRAIGNALRFGSIEEGLLLHDYCRYVDDLRLVVSVDTATYPESRISSILSAWAQKVLYQTVEKKGEGLEINAKKTEVEPYSSVGGQSGTAARMKSLQQDLSGPFDMATLQQVETGLSGLLAIAELGLREPPPSELHADPMPLASVARPKLEVRDDTLTRFSAHRLAKSLRMRRRMTDLSGTDGLGLARDVLLHDFEVAARRLVAAWSVNPSLVQVLRYSLDLFPSPAILDPILSALVQKCEGGSQYEKNVALFVLADLFRAGATDTGQNSSEDPTFPVGDIHTYRQMLADTAEQVLSQPNAPWYVQQQAALLLASLRRARPGLFKIPEVRSYRVLHEYVAAESNARGIAVENVIAISLVGHQLVGDPEHYIKWFRRFARRRNRDSVRAALEIIGQINEELLRWLTLGRSPFAATNEKVLPSYLRSYLDATQSQQSGGLEDKQWISLARVIAHNSAPFNQENTLLQLARALAKLIKQYPTTDPETLTPLSIELRCDNWRALANPRLDLLRFRFQPKRAKRDPRYQTPSWCDRHYAWMYAIGRLLRSAATREFDFTARYWILRETPGWYHGIHSTWHKRRFGMLHTPNALAGTGAAITPWFSELLLRLLRWPGIAADNEIQLNLDDITSLKEFEAFIEARLATQARVYGYSSDLPVYVYPVQWPVKDRGNLRVALIQGLMLREGDFRNGISGIGDAGLRARHRDHTSSILHLAYKKIQARESILGRVGKPHVDIVVLPEYCIHVDDQDLMRAFSDATGSILFYGLAGALEPGTTSPINAARWLVPQRRGSRRSWIAVDQGKQHLTAEEKSHGVKPWRPHQVIIELKWNNEPGYKISGAVCYDATDLSLAADLKNQSHMFVVPAMNKDVVTFDGMVTALRYHMYQHVLVANSGEFGGSTAQAPYFLSHKRLISHSHGSEQISISVFDVDVEHFGPTLSAAGAGTSVTKVERLGKTPPAGLNRT
jgi:hypothetical protein